MDSQRMMMMFPGITPEEFVMLQNLTAEMSEQQLQQFITFYQGKRRDPQSIMILTIIGFFGVAGIQRFILGETGLGLLYLFTWGFCGIGTLVDLINYKKLASEFNQRQAYETAAWVKMLNENNP